MHYFEKVVYILPTIFHTILNIMQATVHQIQKRSPNAKTKRERKRERCPGKKLHSKEHLNKIETSAVKFYLLPRMFEMNSV